jgi:hypothetical protein
MNRVTLSAFLLLLWCGCGDDSNAPSRNGGAGSGQHDSGVNAGSPGARDDSGLQQTGAGPNDASVGAASGDANALTEIPVDLVMPDLPASSNMPTVGTGVAGTVPACASGQFACNGACLASDAPGAEMNGCKLIDGKFFRLGLRLQGDVAYGVGDRNESSGQIMGAYRIALDGTGVTLLSEFRTPSLQGIHEDKLIISAAACAGKERYTTCLSTLPIGGGTPSPLFPDLYDTKVIIAGGKAIYRGMVSDGPGPVYERALFDGSPVLRFAADTMGGLAALASDGTYAYFSRNGSAFDDEFVLTKLGAPGTTVLVAKAWSDPFTDVFFAGDYFYMVRRIGNDGAHYQRLKLGTSVGEALAKLPLLPVGTSVGGDFVYFTSFSDTVDRIYRMPIAGGPITPVASFNRGELGGFAASGNALYVTLQLGSSMPLVRVSLP